MRRDTDRPFSPDRVIPIPIRIPMSVTVTSTATTTVNVTVTVIVTVVVAVTDSRTSLGGEAGRMLIRDRLCSVASTYDICTSGIK
jgi:hypothetical protein